MRDSNQTTLVRRCTITLVAFVLLAAGLGAAPAGGSQATGARVAAPTLPAAALAPAAGTDPVSGGPTGTGTAFLRNVQVGAHTGFDRVVFTFDDHVPGYQVRYIAKPVIADASGAEVPVAGSFVVEVRMEPASGFDTSGGGTQTYTGPKRIALNGSSLREVVESGDFEAVLHWDAGLRDKVPFTVSTLTAPARLVIDFQAAAVRPSGPPTFTG